MNGRLADIHKEDVCLIETLTNYFFARELLNCCVVKKCKKNNIIPHPLFHRPPVQIHLDPPRHLFKVVP